MTIGFQLQELLQALLGFLRSACFARIWLAPLGGQVLHHDCISMLVSRFTTFTENFVICCNQIIKIFCTRYGSAIASSARGPLLFLSFGRCHFREVSMDTVLTWTRYHFCSRLYRVVRLIKERWVFEKVLSGETEVLPGETLFHQIGPRVLIVKTCDFCLS